MFRCLSLLLVLVFVSSSASAFPPILERYDSEIRARRKEIASERTHRETITQAKMDSETQERGVLYLSGSIIVAAVVIAGTVLYSRNRSQH